MSLSIRIQRIGAVSVPLPSYQTSGSAGLDLYAALPQAIALSPGSRHLVPTGLAFEIPPGFEGQVRPRSGLALKQGLSIVNAPGTIDSDYRGEVAVVLINHGSETITIKPQDRMAQLVIAKVERAELVLVETLEETERGTGGYGSTGQ